MKTDRISQSPELRVLVVDDDPEARQIVVDYLLSYGLNDIYQAADGSEGFNVIRQYDIDLIISDWEMPIVNGIEFLKAIKQDLVFKTTPFIMITSPVSQEQEKLRQATLAQVDAYLVKPFKSETLKSKIEAILYKQDAGQLKGVLVADDEDSVREVIAEILTSMGHRPILHAKDGEEAYRILEDQQNIIGLVISDWEMPKLEGIELLRRVRANPLMSDLPFLMVTSQTSIEQIKVNLAIKAEVDHYLMKPFSVEDFKNKVNLVLRRGSRGKKLKERIEIAKKLQSSEDFENAKLLYSHILTVEPKCVEAYLGLAQVKIQDRGEKGFEEASALIRDAINIAPHFDTSHVLLAQVYEQAKSLDKAITILKEALELCPMSHRLHYEMGRILYKRGRSDAALQELEKAIKIRPDFEQAGELLKLVVTSK